MAVEFGFIGLEDVQGQRVTEVGVEQVWTAVEETVTEYNRVVNAVLASLVMRTTARQKRIELAGAATLQPLDENGNPLPRKTSGYYSVGFPLQRGGHAWGTNRESRALMTVEQVNREVATARQADLDWLLRHILAAVLDNESWSYDAKDEPAAITVYPLANGDAVTYPRRGATLPATDDHYLAQASDIGNTTNPYPGIYTELAEHPSNRVSPAFPVVAFIATSLVADTKALDNFVDLPSSFVIPGISADRADGAIEGQLRFGDRVLGVVDDVIVVEWAALPEDYLFALATGAEEVVMMREQPATELQGLFPEMNDVDGNRKEDRLLRIAGFGVGNRIGACVLYVGSASYAIPTGYDAPLDV